MTYPILRPHLFTVSLLCALLSACGNDAGAPGAAANQVRVGHRLRRKWRC